MDFLQEISKYKIVSNVADLVIGQTFCYHFGNLANDRWANDTLSNLASDLLSLSGASIPVCDGGATFFTDIRKPTVILTQKRIAANNYLYLVRKIK